MCYIYIIHVIPYLFVFVITSNPCVVCQLLCVFCSCIIALIQIVLAGWGLMIQSSVTEMSLDCMLCRIFILPLKCLISNYEIALH